MIVETIVIGGVVIAAISPLCVFTTKQNEETVLTSFGKHTGTKKKPGINFKLPWQKKLAPVSKKVIEITDTIKTKTKDNIFVTMPITMHVQVEDSAKSVFVGDDPITLVKSKITDAVKETISKSDLDELFTERLSIREQIKEQAKGEVEAYGYGIKDVIIDEPRVPESVEKRYNAAKSSEQELIERTNLAEAKKREQIKDAEARKEAARLLGEGIADQRDAIFSKYADQIDKLRKKGMSEEEATKVMALAMTQDTLRDIGEKGNMIISTNNATQTLSEFQSIGQMLTKNPAADNDNKANVATPAHKTPKAPGK